MKNKKRDFFLLRPGSPTLPPSSQCALHTAATTVPLGMTSGKKISLVKHPYVAGNDTIFVIYDSIHHSIFEGQVLAPLLKQLNADIYTNIHIVSFEETVSPAVLATHKKFSTVNPRITLTLFKRPRFIFQTLLWQQSLQLKKILRTYKQSYQLCARGPLAGIIAKQAITPLCTAVTIQARGLLAEEHSYTYKNSKGTAAQLHTLRTKQLYYTEKNAYTPPQRGPYSFSVEAVSPALKVYLIATYGIPAPVFTYPKFDIPPPLSPEEKLLYRTKIRTQLNIPEDAPVYIYNGSLKAWQCPQETITAFKKALAKENKTVFLALTQDHDLMRTLLEQATVPSTSYRVFHVPQNEILTYLCAGDYGMLFREPHPLNWVSRPTKLLEYQAVGLTIIHNNTIALLAHEQ